MLLEAGADPNLHIYAGGSAVNAAYRSRNAEMIALLESYGGVVDGINVGLLGLEDRARQMLEDDAMGRLDPKAFGGAGPEKAIADDLLWGAAGTGQVEIVRMCLARIDRPREAAYWYGMLREPMYIGMRCSKQERKAKLECFRLILERADPSVHGDRSRAGWAAGRSCMTSPASAMTCRRTIASRSRRCCSTPARDSTFATICFKARRSAGRAVGGVSSSYACYSNAARIRWRLMPNPGDSPRVGAEARPQEDRATAQRDQLGLWSPVSGLRCNNGCAVAPETRDR